MFRPFHNKEKEAITHLTAKYEDKKIIVESHVAAMTEGGTVPIRLKVTENFELIPSDYVFGGIAQWRVFFVDITKQVSAVNHSWQKGAVMIRHSHTNYNECIYVIHGRLKNHITGDIIVPSESAHKVFANGGPNRMQEALDMPYGWYEIPSEQDHLIVALEDSEFVIKHIRL